MPGRGYGIRPDEGNPPDDLNSGRLLQGNDGDNDFIYPALQLDHNDVNDDVSVSIAGGPVIDGQYFYGNFAGNGNDVGGEIYSVPFENLLTQNTELDGSETVDDLTWIDDHVQYLLEFDHDQNPLTENVLFDNFSDLLTEATGSTQLRSDIRFGVTGDGTMLISSKRDGSIFLVSANLSSVPEPSGFLLLFFPAAAYTFHRRRHTYV